MSMEIYATSGTKVKYIGASDTQLDYSVGSEPRILLVEGQEYTIDYTDVCGSLTMIGLIEVEGCFNSVFFDDVVH